MTSTAAATSTYEIRLAGHLDDHWSAMLGDLDLVRDGDGTTVLTGPVADQAQLHGVLARVRDFGVPLLSLRTLDRDATATEAVRPTLAHPLSTERLTLRAATTADADGTWAYRRLETVGQWLTEIPTDLEAYRATFTDPARLAATVIVELPDGTLLGDFMLRLEDAWAQADLADQARGTQAELGWVLDPAHTGHGYATEAVHELIIHCFDQLGVRRVVANCFLGNDASWRLMERLGMRREGHAVAESLHRSGQWLDTVTYAVLAEEWTS
ncbi:MAG: GNAT family N-acetyltransferase [Jiangellaceae bacterium]